MNTVANEASMANISNTNKKFWRQSNSALIIGKREVNGFVQHAITEYQIHDKELYKEK